MVPPIASATLAAAAGVLPSNPLIGLASDDLSASSRPRASKSRLPASPCSRARLVYRDGRSGRLTAGLNPLPLERDRATG